MYSLRTYDPTIGRWLQQDPYNQFFSPYCGVGNNPANFNDPTGGYLNGGSGVGMGPRGPGGGPSGGTGYTGGGAGGHSQARTRVGRILASLVQGIGKGLNSMCPALNIQFQNGRAGFTTHRIVQEYSSHSVNSSGGMSFSMGAGDNTGNNQGTQPMNQGLTERSGAMLMDQGRDKPIKGLVIFDSGNTDLDRPFHTSGQVKTLDIKGKTYQQVANFIRKTFKDESLTTVYLVGHGGTAEQNFDGHWRTPEEHKADDGFVDMVTVIGEKTHHHGNVIITACQGSACSDEDTGLMMSQLFQNNLNGQHLYMIGGSTYYAFLTRGGPKHLFPASFFGFPLSGKTFLPDKSKIGGPAPIIEIGVPNQQFIITPNRDGTINVGPY